MWVVEFRVGILKTTVEWKETQHKIYKLLKLLSPEDYIYQLENTKELVIHLHNLHFQGFMRLSEKKRPSQILKLFLKEFKSHSVHVAPVSTQGKLALKNYCMKLETRVAGPWSHKRIYLGSDLITIETMSPWQHDMHQMFLFAPIHSRRSYWFWDPLGMGGKSKLAKFLGWTYKEDVEVITHQKSWDILKQVFAQQNKLLYIFNLTKAGRQDVQKSDLSDAIESIKDGMFGQCKGTNVGMTFMNIPQIWVFANHLPCYDDMAQKRWFVKKVPPLPAHMCQEDPEWTMVSAPSISESEGRRLYKQQESDRQQRVQEACGRPDQRSGDTAFDFCS